MNYKKMILACALLHQVYPVCGMEWIKDPLKKYQQWDATRRLSKALNYGDYLLTSNAQREAQQAIDDGADVNCRNATGVRVIDVACYAGYTHIVKSMVAKKASIYGGLTTDSTALWHAVTGQASANLVQCLIDNKADINQKEVLKYVQNRTKFDVLQCLLGNGAIVDQPDSNGETALMVATRKGCSPSIITLLLLDADPSLRNNNNQSVYDLCPKNYVISNLEIKDGYVISRQNQGYLHELFALPKRELFAWLPGSRRNDFAEMYKRRLTQFTPTFSNAFCLNMVGDTRLLKPVHDTLSEFILPDLSWMVLDYCDDTYAKPEGLPQLKNDNNEEVVTCSMCVSNDCIHIHMYRAGVLPMANSDTSDDKEDAT